MNEKGIGLLVILIAVTIIFLLAGGRLYFSTKGQERKSRIETGIEAIEQAKDLQKVFDVHGEQIQNLQAP